ncbi:trehalose-phosphatase [Noviherbaspirillum sp. Root189]|uniref:trehalose-phosphatase n=1 Tax=Noviherbaspirillum sp. Root189 TaxID=1736487 RepID=UPI000708A9F8|nr:trehalose-phosphatase [Noviherbaspirillum sp. Root189]KRB66353.1 hypothetical protein ASE07_10780 [Noviherbaspirillum sp. Root189]
MSPLFSDQGLRRLEHAIADGLLCAFDFDGTLSPIVARPEDARLPDNIRERLLTLGRYSPIAIITGRSVEDIRSRLGFTPDYVVGNHGLEGVPGWENLAREHEAACQSWRRQLEDALAVPEFDRGIQLEDKRYSMSVHYRHVKDVEKSASQLEKLFAALSPAPRIVAGKCVFNLLAEDRCHKGSALVRLMDLAGAPGALYVGDDVTDEDVFLMRRGDVLSVRIEHSADSAADFFLPHPRDILRLLDELIARLDAAGSTNWLAK